MTKEAAQEYGDRKFVQMMMAKVSNDLGSDSTTVFDYWI